MVAALYRHQFTQGEDYWIDVDLRDDRGAVIDTAGWLGVNPIYTLDGVTPKDSNGDAIALAVTFPITGTVRFAIPFAKTAELSAKRYVHGARLWDSSGKPTYYIKGDVIVEQGYP